MLGSTDEERATMILHEAAHYARKDHWLAAFQAVVRTVFFFHPPVRWACSQIDIERELACDEEVIRKGAEPTTYAEAILKVAEHALDRRATCGVHFAGTARLDRRVDMLFRTPPRVARSAVLLIPVSLLLAPVAALGFLQTRVEAATPIQFRIQVNPIGLIPAEILSPPPVPIAAVIPRAVRSQDPPVNPALTATPLASRFKVAVLKITEEQAMATITLALPYSQFAQSIRSALSADKIRYPSTRSWKAAHVSLFERLPDTLPNLLFVVTHY